MQNLLLGATPYSQTLSQHERILSAIALNEPETIGYILNDWSSRVAREEQFTDEEAQELITERETYLFETATRGHIQVLSSFIDFYRKHKILIEENLIEAAFEAVKWGYLPVLQLLIRAGISVSVENNKEEESLLSLSMGKGSYHIAQWLIMKGAYINNENFIKDLETVFQNPDYDSDGFLRWFKYYVIHERPELLDSRNEAGYNFALSACYLGSLEIVKWLSSQNYPWDMDRSSTHHTGLRIAARGGHLPLVQWFLESNNGEKNERDEFGETILLSAAEYGHLELVTEGLRKGWGTITETDDQGNNILLKIAGQPDVSLEEFLSLIAPQSPPVVYQTNQFGRNILAKAVYGIAIENVRYLLQFYPYLLDYTLEQLVRDFQLIINEDEEHEFSAVPETYDLVFQHYLQNGGDVPKLKELINQIVTDGPGRRYLNELIAKYSVEVVQENLSDPPSSTELLSEDLELPAPGGKIKRARKEIANLEERESKMPRTSGEREEYAGYSSQTMFGFRLEKPEASSEESSEKSEEENADPTDEFSQISKNYPLN